MGYVSTILDPHRDWLDERNRLVALLNHDATTADEEIEMLGRQVDSIDYRLLDRPARTADGLAAKMLLVLQITVEGHDIQGETIAGVIGEAQTILDMGSLAGAPDAIREGL